MVRSLRLSLPPLFSGWRERGGKKVKAQKVKYPPAMWEAWVRSLVGIPWRTEWQPTGVFLLGESPWTEKRGTLHTVHGVTKSRTCLSD